MLRITYYELVVMTGVNSAFSEAFDTYEEALQAFDDCIRTKSTLGARKLDLFTDEVLVLAETFGFFYTIQEVTYDTKKDIKEFK